MEPVVEVEGCIMEKEDMPWSRLWLILSFLLENPDEGGSEHR
jgi:hypothetical protein